MSLDEIKNSREFTAWARLESSNITPLGNAEGSIVVLSAILSEHSPEVLIAEDSSSREDLVLIAEEVLRLRVARLNINRRSLKRLIESPVQAMSLESVWLKLRLSSFPSSSTRQIPVRSHDLSERLHLVSATPTELPKFSAFINLVFDLCRVSAEDIVETINQHLPSHNESSLPYANVIDVGQGGMVTVQHSRSCTMPQLFFDFGWPLRQLEKTAPTPPLGCGARGTGSQSLADQWAQVALQAPEWPNSRLRRRLARCASATRQPPSVIATACGSTE